MSPAARCAVLLLLIPVIAWFATWFEPWVGIPSGLIGVAVLVRAGRGGWGKTVHGLNPGLLLVASVLSFFSTPSGVWVDSWLRNVYITLVGEMVREPWPVWVDTLIPPGTVLLRRYLGWYLWPAMFGRLGDMVVLNWLVPVYHWFALSVTLHILATGLSRRAAPWLTVVFLGSGALPALPLYFLSAHPEVFSTLILPEIDHLASMYHNPHHWLPSVLLPVLLLWHRRLHMPICLVPLLAAATPFWSWTAALGLMPLCAWWLWLQRGRVLQPALWTGLVAACVWFGFIAGYLLSGPSDLPSGWSAQALPAPHWRLWLLAAGIVALLPFPLLLLWVNRQWRIQVPRAAVYASLLACLPALTLRYGVYNDSYKLLIVPSAICGVAWMHTADVMARAGHMRRTLLLFASASLLTAFAMVLTAWVKSDTLPVEDPVYASSWNRVAHFRNLELQVQAENAGMHTDRFPLTLLRGGRPHGPGSASRSILNSHALQPPHTVRFAGMGSHYAVLSFVPCEGHVRFLPLGKAIPLPLEGMRLESATACHLDLEVPTSRILRGLWTRDNQPPVRFEFCIRGHEVPLVLAAPPACARIW